MWPERRDSFSSDLSIPRPTLSTKRQQQPPQQQQQQQQQEPPRQQDERRVIGGRPKPSSTSFTNMAYEAHRDEDVDNDSVNQEIVDAGGGGGGRGGGWVTSADTRTPSRLVSYRRPSIVSGSPSVSGKLF